MDTLESKVFIRKIMIEGNERTLEIYKAPVFDIQEQMIGIVGVMKDITDIIQTQEHIKTLAYTDFLTSLKKEDLKSEYLY